MAFKMRWPTGETATFDGDFWTSNHRLWTPDVLDVIPSELSALTIDYADWRGAEVAKAVGAEVLTPLPVGEPEGADDVVMDGD